ncbi:MAG: hypothetical protein HYZ49_07145 [Chloroflexi bacterium]|nr:hypothetical protein [Chloroflexota bacterium]
MTLLAAWFWLFLTLVPLLFLERWIHRHLQGIFLLLTRDHDLATVFYSAIFLPGVALHEGSHWIIARVLGVRTARISLWPRRQPDGTLRLGFVETEKVDFVREALIGVAPLLAGSIAVVLIGSVSLAVGPVGKAIASGDVLGIGQGVLASFQSADSLIWLYLLFVISNSMMPSQSDRRAWLPVTIMLTLLGIALYYVGAAPLVMQSVGEPLAAGVGVIATAFSITIGVNLIIIPIVWLIEKAIVRVTGLQINY